MKKALILSDGKPGHVNQSLALARIMHWEVEIIRVRFKNRAAKALSYGMDLCALYSPSLLKPIPRPRETPDIIISAGSETYYANKYLSRLWEISNLAILFPRGYRLDFAPRRSNITPLPINLTLSDESWYRQQTALFRQYHADRAQPAIGIAIGGNSKHTTLDLDHFKQQLDEIFSRHPGHAFWITTSRRTPPEIISLIETYPFDYMLIWSQDAFNPLPAFIANCDHLYLTADSASMISEAVSYGSASVTLIPINRKGRRDKFTRFITSLLRSESLTLLSSPMRSNNKKIDLSEQIRTSLHTFLP
jgi:mitochondrial fission protein ELM1